MGWFALTAVTFLHFKNASAEESREIIQIYMASCFIFGMEDLTLFYFYRFHYFQSFIFFNNYAGEEELAS